MFWAFWKEQRWAYKICLFLIAWSLWLRLRVWFSEKFSFFTPAHFNLSPIDPKSTLIFSKKILIFKVNVGRISFLKSMNMAWFVYACSLTKCHKKVVTNLANSLQSCEHITLFSSCAYHPLVAVQVEKNRQFCEKNCCRTVISYLLNRCNLLI